MKNTLKIIITSYLLLITYYLSTAQIAINTDGTNPDASAMLDVSSTDKGILIPRMTTSEREAISSPATGLLVYDTDYNSFWYYANSTWNNLNNAILSDTDNDTKIQVEESSDDDIIRFDLNGTEFMRLDSGRIEILNTGNSVFIGENAGESDDYSDNYNVFIGTEAGYKTTTGEYNFFSGYKSGYKNTTGSNNIFFGSFSGENNTTGNNNIFQGFEAGFSNTTGSSNVFLGKYAGWENTTGNNNIFIGLDAGEVNTTASDNVFIGSNVGTENTTGDDNTFLGSYAGSNNKTGVRNTYLGYLAGDGDDNGSYNTYLGATAGNDSDGSYNVMIGYSAGDYSCGSNNIFIGYKAGQDETVNNKLYIENSSSSSPLIYGDFDVDSLQINGKLNINGAFNFPTTDGTASQVLMTDGSGTINWSTISTTSITDTDGDTKIQVEESSDEDIIRFDLGGTEFMRLEDGRIEILNSNSIYIGEDAGENEGSSSNGNVFIGYQAGKSSTLGLNNNFIGKSAGTNNTIGTGNTFIGGSSGNNNTIGSNNVFIGDSNGFDNTTGSDNTFLGGFTGNSNTEGYQNIFLGAYSGYSNTTGTSNIFLGYQAGYNETGSNKLYIENSNSNTPLIFGDFDVDSLQINGKLNINGAFNFPTTDGTASQVLMTDGSGTINWSTISTTSIADADSDTKIQVEESSDEDIIRFDLNGTEFMRLDNGRIEILNTGQSVFIGKNAGKNDNLVGNSSTFVGHQAGEANTSGIENVFLGAYTGEQNMIGDLNTFIGAKAGNKNTTGNYNTFLGAYAGELNTAGEENVFLGDFAGATNTTGSNNVYIGNETGRDNTTGSNNVFIGNEAGYNETGSNKLYIDNNNTSSPLLYGEFNNDLLQINGTLNIQGNYSFPTSDGASGEALTTDGAGNLTWSSTVVGATTSVADADSDTKIQVEEGSDDNIIRFDMSGTEFIRLDSGRIEIVNTGNSIFIGEEAGYNDNYSSNYNLFMGYQSGYENTSGYGNIFTGYKSGYGNTTGYSNLFLGSSAGRNNTSGFGNIFLGSETGEGNDDGQYNVMIGYQAGTSNTSGDKNIFIGYRAGKNATGSNKLYIDNSATSSPLIYGDFSSNLIEINGALTVTDKITTNSNWISGDGDDEGIFINSDGNIGIGTNSPTQGKLVISGVGDAQSFSNGTYGYWSYNGSATNQSSLSGSYAIYTDQRIAAFVYHAISDERVKDIQGFSDNAADLEILKKIKITNYQFKDKIRNGDITQKKVIAQQVAEVYPQAVTSNTTEIVPDIMQRAIINEKGWVETLHCNVCTTIKKGDKVQILFDEKKELLEVKEVKENTFRVKPITDNQSPITIFVYGRQVNDFHTVDYEAISMLNVSATQQLAKENEDLKQQVQLLQEKVTQLTQETQKIDALEAMLKQLQTQMQSSKTTID